MNFTRGIIAITLALLAGLSGSACRAQLPVPGAKFGEVVPRDVREMYDRGLQFLALKQTDKGE